MRCFEVIFHAMGTQREIVTRLVTLPEMVAHPGICMTTYSLFKVTAIYFSSSCSVIFSAMQRLVPLCPRSAPAPLHIYHPNETQQLISKPCPFRLTVPLSCLWCKQLLAQGSVASGVHHGHQHYAGVGVADLQIAISGDIKASASDNEWKRGPVAPR